MDSIVQTSSLNEINAKFTPQGSRPLNQHRQALRRKERSELFQGIIEEILTQAIQWDNVIRTIIQKAKTNAVLECKVHVFRTSSPFTTS